MGFFDDVDDDFQLGPERDLDDQGLDDEEDLEDDDDLDDDDDEDDDVEFCRHGVAADGCPVCTEEVGADEGGEARA
jgi:hypothetical protein